MRRGEIYFIQLAPRSGSEQRGFRPGIVVSRDAFSDDPRWRSITVVPLTSSQRWMRPSLTTVRFGEGECNLPKACAALAHQVTTVDKAKLVAPPIGRLSPGRLAEIEAALRAYLAM